MIQIVVFIHRRKFTNKTLNKAKSYIILTKKKDVLPNFMPKRPLFYSIVILILSTEHFITSNKRRKVSRELTTRPLS